MDNFVKKLRLKGYRLTNQRRKIMDALTPFPQSITEIISQLKERGMTVNKVTVYRTLYCFVKIGIVGKTQFKDKKAKYELMSEGSHHHHLVCDNCGSVEDIPLNDEYLVRKISQQTDFQIKSHSLEFFGICIKCR